MKPVTIIIGGDLAPTKSNYSQFEQGNIEALIDKDTLSLLNSVDHRIFNLELPLTDFKKPISKDGPNLYAPVATLNGIKKLNPTILGIANNHIMDHDEQGLLSTMEHLSNNNIQYVGSGKDIAAAMQPVFVEKEKVKIGIYACAENEFSIAEENYGGANPFDPLESFDHIVSLKSVSNYVIVLYHGGKEEYRYPSPYLQKVCRKFVDKGADLVVCQHSHCIGAFENYNSGSIVYGQGNFIFDLTEKEFWQTSLLIKATFGEQMRIDFFPVQKNGIGVKQPDTQTADNILEAFNSRSEKILEKGFIEAEYDRFCIENGLYYLGAIAGLGRVSRKINSILRGVVTKMIYSLNKLNMLQNFIECEAHRELLIRYLKLKRKM